MKTNTATDTDPIIRSLKTLAQDSPHLKDAAKLYEAILPLLRDADIRVGHVALTPEQARSKMEKGLPLLHDLDLELDMQSVRGLMLQLVRAIGKFGKGEQEGNGKTLRASAASRIRGALEEDRLDISEILTAVAAGKRDMVTSATQGIGLDSGLVRMLARNALKPAFRAWRRQLTPLAEKISWDKGSCFICGADAILAELHGNTQVKHLRCGQCGADWPFPRLQCMYCGNEDHTSLGYLYSENQAEKFRVEVCEKCKGYLKVIAAFSPTPPEILSVEDLATLHLDYIAQERGYTRR